MNKIFMTILLLVGMGIGAGILGPSARHLLTDARAETGSLVYFTVETHQGLVALRTKSSDGMYGTLTLNVESIEPVADGKSFNVFFSAGLY